MRQNYTLSKLFVALTATSFVVLPGYASADPETHQLSLTTETLKNIDCGGGSCVPACKVEASLMVMPNGPARTPELNVQFWYKTDHIEGGEAAISLQFGEVKARGTSSATAWVPGYACRDIELIRTEIGCLEGQDGKCAGYYKVRIPAVSALGLEETSLEAK